MQNHFKPVSSQYEIFILDKMNWQIITCLSWLLYPGLFYFHADWCYQSQMSCDQPCKGNIIIKGNMIII